jgi:hypothetical protein
MYEGRFVPEVTREVWSRSDMCPWEIQACNIALEKARNTEGWLFMGDERAAKNSTNSWQKYKAVYAQQSIKERTNECSD